MPGSRKNLLKYGSMVFNGHGPRNHIFEEAMRDTDEVRAWVNAQCSREMLLPGRFGDQIYQSVETGDLTEEEAGLLVRSFLSAGVDTTVNALGFAILNFARSPQQWAELHADPSLARDAFEEVVRLEAPVSGFFRATTKDTEIAGTMIPQASKVLVLYSGACRDPRRWDDPDSFDIHRRPVGHNGFGSGIHGCVGAIVARLEGEVLLGALARRVSRIERTGEPRVRLNNTLRGLESLPVCLHAS
jgi:cytochrome P450